ncbi:hypothetical protein [Bosea sp. PAMC 26642]|uniref:hypothetical protein n=1 Tax=Bosea sp. (strain PAMC 26642) TaxID=1792307 RepID=UPI0007702B45|nr:hypothetical protein [Bosea sp. PAMC 26642]AMJ60527.1 hypothetical protein AXW83_09705 [Bosea sp. PAMC 26642]
MHARRGVLIGLGLLASTLAAAQPRPARPASGPGISASQRAMAGSMLSVFLSRAPAGARLAIARPADPAALAIVVLEPASTVPTIQTPGEPGRYELRLTVDRDGQPVILLRQPLETTMPSATLAAPARAGRSQTFPVRGIGPNGERDRIVIVPTGAAVDAPGPFFLPHENVEATLETPDQPGSYELRYVMDAPLSGRRILATRTLTVD